MARILLVDDEPDLIGVASAFLKRAGISVRGARSAREARIILSTEPFDAIVSDYEMPGEKGLCLLKEIRGSGDRTPFIIFTGRGREEVVIEALNTGADFYLQKGGETEAVFTELIHVITTAIDKRRIEQSLIESENRYRAIVESQKELICRFSTDWKIIFVNGAFCRYFQVTEQDVDFEEIINRLNSVDREAIRNLLMNLTPCHPAGIAQNQITHPDGTLRYQEWTFTAFFSETGEVTEFQAVGRDITEKRRMENTIAENLNYVRALMDSIPAPVFYRDTEGVYKDCNQAFENLVGLKKSEIIGMTIRDFFPPDLADHYRHMDDLIIESPYIQQYEYTITNTRGEKFDVLFSKTGLQAADGTVKGIVGVIFDISERKKFEQIVFESEEKYRTLAEYTHDWEAWLSPEGKYLYVSPSCERITGYTTGEFLADPALVIRITHPDDLDTIRKHYEHMPADTSGVYHLDYRIITREGEERWISHFCQAVYRDDGTWLGRRENKRDITFRKQIEKALQQANLKLNLLSSITRHDVLNQLTALIGYTDMALEMAGDPDQRFMLKQVMDAANAITGQITFTRAYQEIGLYEPVWQRIPVTVRRAATGVKIPEILVDPCLEDLEVRADPLLEKVFYCLLDNSQRHGKNVSKARISGHLQSGSLVLVYEDDGAGIGEDIKERIFERGFGKNTGYGLFLAREILSISGNTIRETGTPGVGARFEIGFPPSSFRVHPPQNRSADP